MRGHLLIGGVQVRLVAAGLRDAGFRIIGHHQLWAAAQELERAHMCTDPGSHLLIFVGLGVGVVAGTEHGHEQRGLMYLVALRVVNGHRRAGPIDEQLLSWTMLLTQDEIALLLPAPVKLAELAVSVALGMRGAVLLPEQLPGGVLVPLQLFVNAYEVGQWAVGIQCRVFARCGRKQSRFHLRLGHLSRQRPTQSRRREPFEVIMDRALADVGAAGDLSLPQLEIETQPQNFSALAHGHSLSGHLDLLSEAQSTRSLVSSAAKLFSTGDSEASRSRFRPSPISDRLGPGTVIAFSPEQ